MERVLEPELMDDEAQATAYAEADFAEPNQAFVDRFVAMAPGFSGHMLDLGCGPADIPVRMCQALPELRVTAVDGSAAMLAHGARALSQSGMTDRVRLVEALVPGSVPGEQFDAVVSNSLLHHLPDPAALWSEITATARPGAPILVVDLMRPASAAAAQAIVDQYSADEPEVLRTDFYNSLLAAFTVAEVRAQLRAADLADALTVEAISDRHLAVAGVMPPRGA